MENDVSLAVELGRKLVQLLALPPGPERALAEDNYLEALQWTTPYWLR